MRSSKWWGYLLVLASAASFGFLPLFVTRAREAGLSNETTLIWRYVIASVIFLPYALLHDRWRPTRRGMWWLVIVGLVLSPMQAVLYIYSVQYAGPALATLLLHLYPVFVCLGAVAMRRQRWSWWIPGFLALAFVGIGMTVGEIRSAPVLGLILGTALGIGYAVYVLAVDVAAGFVPSRTLAAVGFLGTAIAIAIIGFPLGRIQLPASAQGWVACVGLGVVCTIAAVWLFYEGMSLTGAAHASLVSMSEAVFALVVSVLFLGTRLDMLQWTGAVLVIVSAFGGILLTSSPAKEGRGATRAPKPPEAPPTR